MTKTQEQRERILAYYKSKTPIFLITESDKWISGYINDEPGEFKFFVLDWRELKPVPIMYVDIRLFEPFEGDFSKLPLPKYLEEK